MIDEEDTAFNLEDDGWFLPSKWSGHSIFPMQDGTSRPPVSPTKQIQQPPFHPPQKDIMDMFQAQQNSPALQENSQSMKGMEASAVQALNILQRKGQVQFKEMINELGIDHRRGYDLCNVLLTTPLVSKQGSRKENNQPFVWCNPRTTDRPIDISRLKDELQEARQILTATQERVKALREKVGQRQL